MKRFAFALAILLSAAAPAIAQQDNKTQVQTPAKTLFASDINKLDAGISRNIPALADKAYNALATSITKDIAATTDTKSVADKKQLYTEIQNLNTDRKKNRAALIAKLRQYNNLIQ